MCGRYLSFSDPELLAEHFAVDAVRTSPLPERYNVAPTQEVYAILERDQQRRLGALRWGFVPTWATQLRGTRQPINARVESVATSKMFATSFAHRRCILPADGFYEWQDQGEGRRKQPYHLQDPDGAPLAFAAIWTLWRDPADDDAPALASAAIVTTASRGELTRLHDRMPVMLPERLWGDWLTADADDAPHLRDVIAALDAPPLIATPIGDAVNSVANDGPHLLEPGEVA